MVLGAAALVDPQHSFEAAEQDRSPGAPTAAEGQYSAGRQQSFDGTAASGHGEGSVARCERQMGSGGRPGQLQGVLAARKGVRLRVV